MRSSWPFTALLILSFCARANAQLPGAAGGAPSEPSGSSQGGAPSSSGPSPNTALSGQSAFQGGVPSGKATPGVMPLRLREAIDRGLRYNLGAVLADEGTLSSRGSRLRALSQLLPHLNVQTSETREQLNLKALGFPGGIPGIPTVVGPFNIFDVRAYLSQSVFDLNAINGLHSQTESVKAAQYNYKDARDLVVLTCANLYLQAIAGFSRVDAIAAEVKTAQAVYDQTSDMKKAGTVPGIDVLRSQVELQQQQQRLIAAQNDFQKQKLNLARAIGLPTGQEFSLSDQIPYAAFQPVTLDEALAQAYRSRGDYQSAVALVRAAESNKKAAQGSGLPTVKFNADFGDIGTSPTSSHETFTVAGNLTIPIFQGGLVRGKVMEADALLRQRKAQMEDLRSRIDYDVRTAFLDLKSATDQVQVATSNVDLAKQQVAQARDRFAAGVANSVEVVQTEQTLATADDNYISALYSFNVAKASLARAIGVAENTADQLLGGRQ